MKIHFGHLKNHQSYIEKLQKKKTGKKDPFNREKWNFQKNDKSLQFSMLQGSLNLNITILGEKL